jgi:hypothetical protein
MWRLFKLTSMFSIILCIALTAIWIRSQGHYDLIYGEGKEGGFFRADSEHGNLCVAVLDPLPPVGGVESSLHIIADHESSQEYSDPPGLLGVSSGHGKVIVNDIEGGSLFLFPALVITARYRTLTILAALLPTLQLSLWLRQRRRGDKWRKSGRCRNCGYDLRATPNRCPECGAAAGKAEGHTGKE